jgi:hypothetical protein
VVAWCANVFMQDRTPSPALKKVDMHKNMNYVIAGVEQQKADDLAVIDRSLTR